MCFALLSASQDLTGLWEGTASGHVARLCIIRYKNGYVGYTYDEGMGYCKAHFLGTYNEARKKLKGINEGFIEKKGPHSQSRYNLTYMQVNGQDQLRGTLWAKTTGARLMSFGMPVAVQYHRVSYAIPDTTGFMLERMGAVETIIPDSLLLADTEDLPADTAAATANHILAARYTRRADTLSVITTPDTSLLLKLVDNGIVDGDTVSIIHNGRIVAERIGVTAQPYELRLPVRPGNRQEEIILVAHNLGSIAPNTAMVIIETGNRQYRLFASTDLSRNAVIIFRYQE